MVCFGRRTITGLLAANGNLFNDWSADYRLFEKKRFCVETLFKPAREYVMSQLTDNQALTVFMDDTKIKKKGKKVYGTSWNRDPLGPPFQTNFIWGQRFIQLALALPQENLQASMARAIPIGFHHAPPLRKPNKAASHEEWNKWKKESKKHRLTVIGSHKIRMLRNQMDASGQKHRKLIVVVDGGFTNATTIKSLPYRTTLIGRIRKDAKIFDPPKEAITGQQGRKKYYGDQKPTPEQLRQDHNIPWTSVKAFAAGKIHDFDIKVVNNIRWKGAGDHRLRLLVVRPLAYRLTKKSRLLYRDPAYIICTDSDLSPEQVMQNFVWRWEIELNFRDEKTLMGVGEAQARTKEASSLIPPFIVAAYSYLQIACHKTYGFSEPKKFVKPKWQLNKTERRLTTQKMIGLFRANLWGKEMGVSNFSDFMTKTSSFMKSILLGNSLFSAVFYGVK